MSRISTGARSHLVACALFVAFSGSAFAQCAPALPAPSATTPIDISFRTPDRARVVTTGNFDGIGGTETAVTADGFPIVRVDTAVAGTVTVRGNSDSYTYTLPAAGMYAVVFPFPNSGSVTFRVTDATGPASGGTAVWAGSAGAPLTVVTAVDDGSGGATFCASAEDPTSPQAAARLSHRLSLQEIGTWRQRVARPVSHGGYTWGRMFSGGGGDEGNRFGVQAGLGRSFDWGRGSVFFSYGTSSLSDGGATASASHIGAGITATLEGAGGSYIDFVARLAEVTRSLETTGGEGRTSGLGYALSAETGLRVFEAGPVTLQPELQVVVTGASLPAFTLPDGGTATYSAGPAVYARAGLAALPATGGVWARADLWSELQSGTAVEIDGGLTGDLDAVGGETWVDLTLGFGQAGAAGLGGSVTARVGSGGVAYAAEARLTIPF